MRQLFLIFLLLSQVILFGQSATISGEKSSDNSHDHISLQVESACKSRTAASFCGYVFQASWISTESGRQALVGTRFRLPLTPWLEIQPGVMSVVGVNQKDRAERSGGGVSLGWKAAKGQFFSEGVLHQYLSPVEEPVTKGLKLKPYSLGEAQAGVRFKKYWSAGAEFDRAHNSPELNETAVGGFVGFSKGLMSVGFTIYPATTIVWASWTVSKE